MIADIILIIVATFLYLIYLVTVPFAAILNATDLNTPIASAISWLFTPLRYFGYWIDLATLGQVLNLFFIFLTLWFTYQLIRMAISLKSGEIESPEM